MLTAISRILAWIFSGTVIGAVVRYIIEVIGVGVVSYIGFSALNDQLQLYALSAFSGVSADAIGLMGLMGFDAGINLILSGCSIRVVSMATKHFRRR